LVDLCTLSPPLFAYIGCQYGIIINHFFAIQNPISR
jgi:hypothetical protein